MRIFCFEKNMYLNSIKNDHADGCRSGCGLIRSILGILELSSEKNHTFITIWKSWFSYEFPLLVWWGYQGERLSPICDIRPATADET